jgi:hypothetical protein
VSSNKSAKWHKSKYSYTYRAYTYAGVSSDEQFYSGDLEDAVEKARAYARKCFTSEQYNHYDPIIKIYNSEGKLVHINYVSMVGYGVSTYTRFGQ